MVCPYVEKKKKELNLPSDQKATLMFDVFKGHVAEVTSIIEDRSSRPDVFCKKGVLRNVSKFTVKHQCQNLFF